MNLIDIAKKIEDNDIIDKDSLLDMSIDIHDIKKSKLENCNETVFVVNDKKDVIGKIEKELLTYISDKTNTYFFNKALDFSEDGIIAVDSNGRIFYLNKAYTSILNVKAYKIIGKYIQNIEPNSLLLKSIKSRKAIENKYIKIDSIGKYVSVKIKPIFLNSEFIGSISYFRDVTKIHQLNREVEKMEGIVDEYSRKIDSLKYQQDIGIITQDKKLLNMLIQAEVVAQTDVPVLIMGENGVGKEVFANYVHQCSKRKDKPLIVVNCAAIPENLMESELFGYEEGAFTGASKGGKKGKFELADKGTIFLDEIGDMPLLMQSKLLRTLQEGEIEKIGRQKKIPVDVRIIAATNQPLETMVREKTFRQDLYFRINTISLEIPPLRERKGDIVLLAKLFLEEFNKKYNKNLSFSSENYSMFQQMPWYGNVRELKNYIERFVILSDKYIDNFSQDLQNYSEKSDSQTEVLNLNLQLKNIEKNIILNTLKKYNYDKNATINSLGISKRSFYRKIQNMDIN